MWIDTGVETLKHEKVPFFRIIHVFYPVIVVLFTLWVHSEEGHVAIKHRHSHPEVYVENDICLRDH